MNMRSVVLLIAAFAVVSFLYVIRMLGVLELEEHNSKHIAQLESEQIRLNRLLKEYQSSADIDRLEIEKLRAELKVRRGGHNPARALESHQKNLIYVIGAEGSGSYWMTYHVAKNIPEAYFLPQVYPHEPDEPVVWENFSWVNHQIWSSGPILAYYKARQEFPEAVANLFANLRPHKRMVVLHRSFPDFGTSHYPDLVGDFFDLAKAAGYGVKLIVMYREPREAAFSTMRRGFAHTKIEGKADMMLSSKMTEKHLVMLSRQLELTDHSHYVVLSYADLVGTNETARMKQIRKLATFLDFPVDKLRQPLQWKESGFDANVEETAFLDHFFTPERLAQWSYLTGEANAGN